MKRLPFAITLVTLALSPVAANACEGDPACLGEKIAKNCVMCHGPSYQGYFVAPRLAGQRAQYIEEQIKGFLVHKRNNPYSELYMWRAAAKLSSLEPDAIRSVSVYLSTLEPEAAKDGKQELVSEGASLFAGGEPAENVPACAVCHGPNAVGAGTVPRLGGLSFTYLKRRLIEWGEGYHSSTPCPMPQVAKNLSDEKIEALASYLSFIDYREGARASK